MCSRDTRHVLALERRCDDLERERIKAEESVEQAAQGFSLSYARLQAVVDTAQAMMRQQGDTIQDFRSTVKNMEIELNQAVAVNTRNHERVKTETAIEVQKQAAFVQPPDTYGVR